MAFLTMEISIAMYSRRRDLIVLVSKYRRRVVTKQILFQLQEVLQKSERKPSAFSGGMNLALEFFVWWGVERQSSEKFRQAIENTTAHSTNPCNDRLQQVYH